MKKAGIFPIVHGVRALALEAGIDAAGTEARLRRLAEKDTLDAKATEDLVGAFGFLLSLRLDAGLERLRLHEPLTPEVETARLSKLERDLLKDSLLAVRRFREVVRHHFRLEQL